MGTFLLLLTLWTDSTSSSEDSHMYITQNTGYTSISPFVGILLQCWLLAVHWGRYHWNGGIYQGYWNVLLLFLCGLCVQIFFMVAHATLEVSDSVIRHCRRPVCAWLLFLLNKTLFFRSLFLSGQWGGEQVWGVNASYTSLMSVSSRTVGQVLKGSEGIL